MTAQARTVAFATAAILAVLLLGAGVLIGRGSVSSAQRSSTTNPIALVNGVPVGVADTPAGAIAANDNYLATEAQTDEQDPKVFATLVATVFTPPRASCHSKRRPNFAAATQRSRAPTPLVLGH